MFEKILLFLLNWFFFFNSIRSVNLRHSRYDGQNTSSTKMNVTDNYKSINWTPLRSDALLDFYEKAPIEMQCQSGAGKCHFFRFIILLVRDWFFCVCLGSPLPGKWTNMAKTEVKLAQQEIQRPCAKDQTSKGSSLLPQEHIPKRLSLLNLIGLRKRTLENSIENKRVNN